MTAATEAPPAPPTGIAAGLDYAAGMVKLVLLGIQEIRDKFTTQLTKTEAGEHVVVTRHGKPIAAFVPMDWYREMRKLSGDPTEL